MSNITTILSNLSTLTKKIRDLESFIVNIKTWFANRYVSRLDFQHLTNELREQAKQISNPDVSELKRDIISAKIFANTALKSVKQVEKDIDLIKKAIVGINQGLIPTHITNNTTNTDPIEITNAIISRLEPLLSNSNAEIKDALKNIKIDRDKYSTITKKGGKFIPTINTHGKTNIKVDEKAQESLDAMAELLKQVEEGNK